MCALSVKEASETYASAMRNVPPAGEGICARCHCFVDPAFTRCYKCGQELDSLDLVVPITYSEDLGQLHLALRRYKSAPTKEAREFAAVRLLAILWRFLELHEHCMTNALGIVSFDVVTVVPSSTRTRDRASRLRAIVKACGPVKKRFEPLLAPAEHASDTRQFDPDRYEPQRSLHGENVLLIDDTWASGAHAQSAAYALKQAGAAKVAMVVIGRHVNPGWEVGGKTSRALLDALARDFDWETCAVHDD
jgi:predicted amidophosphoribosyltransferase